MPADLCECWLHGRPHPVSHRGPQCPRPSWPRALDHWFVPGLYPCTRTRSQRLAHLDHLWPPGTHLPPKTLAADAGLRPLPWPGLRVGLGWGDWVTEKSVVGRGAWRAGSAPFSPAWI